MSEETPKTPERGSRRWIVLAALWALAAITAVLVYRVATPNGVEHAYSRGIFHGITKIVIPITEKIPFSFSLLLTCMLIFGGPLLWAFRWRQAVRAGKGHLAGFLWAPTRLLFLVPVIFVWFALFWGTGYQRPPVEERFALGAEKPTAEEITKLLDGLLVIILRDQPAPRNVPRAVQSIAKSMGVFIHETEDRYARIPQWVKATPPGWLLFNSTSGICSPFTLEANVDGAIPDTGFVYVAAHELAHTAGINREGEATLYGQIAGLRADDAFARYAVALDAYSDLLRDLEGDTRKAYFEKLPQSCRDELKKIREVSNSYNLKWFSERSWKVYNSYLQSQGIKEGTKNYSASTRLFVQASRKGLIHLDVPGAVATPQSAG